MPELAAGAAKCRAVPTPAAGHLVSRVRVNVDDFSVLERVLVPTVASKYLAAMPSQTSSAPLSLRLAADLGLSRCIADWLVTRGHSDAEAAKRFLEPRLSELSPPDEMIDRAKAARRIAGAIVGKERIVVYGDYDCDGITSTAIMTQALRQLGGNVEPLLASRFEGGYGVSAVAADKIAALGPRLLVTCDCGSSDHESLARLTGEGIDVVVIDHHLVPEEPLPALAFLNPHRPECQFPYKGLASCGLALSVVAAVRKELGKELDVRQWLDLVAIGSIADVAPLDADNRALVRAGLRALAQSKRPGLAALLQLANVSTAGPLTARDVAFRIAPMINAPGRMGSPLLALQLLLAQEESTASALAGELAEITAQRRQEQDRVLAAAREQIEERGWADEAAIVVAAADWNHGIVGIVAGRLSDDYGRPVAVAGFDGERGRGSVRGPEGSRLYDALKASQEHLTRFGGHQAAAGFELTMERVDDFRLAFVRAVTELGPPLSSATVEAVVSVSSEDSPERVLLDLDRLEPCWDENPRPVLELVGDVVLAREVGEGHLKLRLDLGRYSLDCFGVRLGQGAESMRGRVRVRGDLRRNTFRGVTQPELFLQSVAPVESEAAHAGGSVAAVR